MSKVNNPQIYTIDSFYYYFIWMNENDTYEHADLSKEYEVLIYVKSNNEYLACNKDYPLIITYNTPVSVLDIEELCKKDTHNIFKIPDNCLNCVFKIREKKDNPDDWDTDCDFFPIENNEVKDYALCPLVLDCDINSQTINCDFIVNTGTQLRDFINQTSNKISKYGLYCINNSNENDITLLNNNCILQNDSFSGFQNYIYYNSKLQLNTNYNLNTTYIRNDSDINNFPIDVNNTQLQTVDIIPREEHRFSNTIASFRHELGNGVLVYIKNALDGEWTIDDVPVSKGYTYPFYTNSLNIQKLNENSSVDLEMIMHGIGGNIPSSRSIDYHRFMQFTTGGKYTQQIEAFDDLETIRPISDVSNDEFTYQYDSINGHTPVFIYQKMIDDTYNLTNNSSNLNIGVLNTDFENTSKNDLIVTTSPVVDASNNYSLKTSNITEEEINKYTEEHKNMLNVNKVFNSLEEKFEWEYFDIIQDKGEPVLRLKGTKPYFSNLYTYQININNQMSDRSFLQENILLRVFTFDTFMPCVNGIYYFPESRPYPLTSLKENELSSKEKYHIIVKRIYEDNEYIIDERDIIYENNSDFFLAPTNNINYNPGEEVDFYFSTERNDSENAAQGYPWLIYNNEDNVGYFCYSNEAYNNNADNRGIDNYDSNKSDNKQLIHINYHNKPNFTPKEVIPMLDFKITELVETTSGAIINPSSIFNQTNIILIPNSNGVNVQTNGENASFTISTSFIDNSYLSFNGGSISGMGQIEILDNDTEQILFSTANSGSCFILTNLWNGKYVNNNTGLSFNFKSNGYINFYNTRIQTLKKPETDTLLNKRKFYIDNFSVNEIDYSEIENGSVITGQVLELHKPITLYIEDFTTNMSSNNSIYYKIEKVNEYNQDVITPIDDDNSITILQKDDNDNVFTKDFYINSHTNQLKIQNTKTKQITFNNTQKDTIINCILEKEEVED